MLFTTQPGLGHLLPLLPLADALTARGDAVLFAASPSFSNAIAEAGHSSASAGLDWLTSRMADAFPEVASHPPGEARYSWARRTVFALESARASVPDLVTTARSWGADLIVREAAEYAGCVAAEVVGIPHAVVRTDSGSSSYAARTDVGDSLDRVRHEAGLAPDPEVVMPFRFLTMSFAPRCLDRPSDGVAPTLRYLRAGETPPARTSRARARPRVYATLGTVYNDPDVLASIVEALAPEDLDLVVTVGPTLDPEAIGPAPDNVRIERWLPQHELLPHCDVVVTHGGYGTIAAALAAACPLVVLPFSADQPRNAEGCATAGVGMLVPPADRTPAAIRAATIAVLAEPKFAQAASAEAAELAARPGVDHALELLDGLVRSGQPVGVS